MTRTDSATVCALCSSDGLFLVVFSYQFFFILEPVEKSEVKFTGVCERKLSAQIPASQVAKFQNQQRKTVF